MQFLQRQRRQLTLKRDVPIGLAICLTVVIILYIGVSLTLTGMIPFKSVDVNNAIPGALSKIGIMWGSSLVGAGAVIGMDIYITSNIIRPDKDIHGYVKRWTFTIKCLRSKKYLKCMDKNHRFSKCTIMLQVLTTEINMLRLIGL